MPNRMLKETITTSPEIEQCSDGAEVLFYRLTVKADDHGRHDGRLTVMKSLCFPIRKRMSEGKLARQLVELLEAVDEEGTPLVSMYQVKGRPYLQISKWEKHQRIRAAQSKFPPPSDGEPLTSADICPQVSADDRKSPSADIRGHLSADVRPIRKRSTKSKSKAKSGSDSKSKTGSDVESPTDVGEPPPTDDGRVSHEPQPRRGDPERAGMSAEARRLAAMAERNARKAASS